MIILGTYIGFAVAIIAAGLFILCLRWQFRLGGFCLYAIGAFVCMTYMGLVTWVESATLSQAAIQSMFDETHSGVKTVEEFRQVMVASHNSMIISNCFLLLLVVVLLWISSLTKYFRLRFGKSKHEEPNNSRQKDAGGEPVPNSPQSPGASAL